MFNALICTIRRRAFRSAELRAEGKKRCGIGAIAGVVLLTLIGSECAGAASEDDCEARLTVELTPDVPDISDFGFLSSLVSKHRGYRRELLQQIDPSLLELELSEPGLGYLCLNIIETMRKDALFRSISILPRVNRRRPRVPRRACPKL